MMHINAVQGIAELQRETPLPAGWILLWRVHLSGGLLIVWRTVLAQSRARQPVKLPLSSWLEVRFDTAQISFHWYGVPVGEGRYVRWSDGVSGLENQIF